MIDSTGSMEDWINGVKNKCQDILDKLNENKKLKLYNIKFGGVFYRDPIDTVDKEKKDEHEHQPLGNVDELKIKMKDINTKGGGDTPEDWVGAYKLALDKSCMKWRKRSIKIIIHIADAGAHTLRFSDGDKKHNKKEYEIELVNLIKKCAEEKINIFGYQIGEEPKKSFTECKKIYDSVKFKQCNYDIYHFEQLENATDKEIAEKLKENIIHHISAFFAKN